MQYALHCKLAEKNNELPPKPFQIFLSGGAGVEKSFLVETITEYLQRFLRYPNQNLDQPSVLKTASTGKAAKVSMVLYCILHFISLLSQG